MSLSRRDLLKLSAKNGSRDTLVCIFQRGAADGLNALVPHGDADYYAQRPQVAIPPPGQSGGAIDVDGFFGLHPSLAPLQDLYAAGDLALVHATGVPHGTRSHFDAQSLVEGGVVDKAALGTGWIGRHLASTPALRQSAFRAVAISGSVPASLIGAEDPIALDNIAEFGIGDAGGSSYQDTLDALYAPERPFAAVAQAALGAMDELAAAGIDQFQPENGADYPPGELGGKLLQAAQMIKADLGAEIICIDVGGWDHHENINNFLPASLDGLARSLAAFDQDLGARMDQVTVVVMTEFGRRVAQNGSAGTDHGTGNLIYLLGGGVNGGQIVARWPGLGPADLAQGEDLAITTDARDLLIQLLERRLGNLAASTVFPDYQPGMPGDLFL